MLKLSAGRAHRELCGAFPKSFSSTRGTPVRGRKASERGFRITRTEAGFVVEHHTSSDWFRALGELARNESLRELSVVPQFEERGLLLDASRNGVPHCASLEQRIIELA